MTLSVCLLPDRSGETVVRRLWARLEEDGVPTLASHTHGRHLPHLTLAAVRSTDPVPVLAAVAGLPASTPTSVRFDSFGTFRRSRCWLGPVVTRDLLDRQQQVARAVLAAGLDLHRHYRPDGWTPHLAIAPRLHLRDLPLAAGAVYDVLPLTLRMTHSAVVDTATGAVHPVER